MYQGIRPYVTGGVALVGASVIAVSPVTAPPPDVHAAPLPVAQRVVTLPDVQLASLSEDWTRFLQIVAVADAGDLAEYDFVDAAALTVSALQLLPVAVVLIPPILAVSLIGGAPPEQVAYLVVNSVVRPPLNLAKPWVVASANILPAPLGGVPNEASSAPGQGILMDTWHSADDALTGLLTGIFLPNQQLAVRDSQESVVERNAIDNVDELTNVGVQNGTPELPNGSPETKQDRPRLGSNVRAAVKEVRGEVRDAVKDVRQGVREAIKDTVKAVTSIGKKKDEEQQQDPPNPGD